MSNQYVDVGVEIILKLSDDINEVAETMVKLEDGSIFTIDGFLTWVSDNCVPYWNFTINYTLEIMNSPFNYSKLSKFITDKSGNAALNENLAKLASESKNYSKWIENYNDLYDGATELVSLGNIPTSLSKFYAYDVDKDLIREMLFETDWLSLDITDSEKLYNFLKKNFSKEWMTAVAV